MNTKKKKTNRVMPQQEINLRGKSNTTHMYIY